MVITVNDADTSVTEGATVADLVQQLGLSGTRVAVEVNLQLVRRADHASLTLQIGDRVEVVTLVGGG